MRVNEYMMINEQFIFIYSENKEEIQKNPLKLSVPFMYIPENKFAT